MKVRKFQHLNEEGSWVDEADACEDDTGQVEFRYNTLTWGRVGAELNRKIQAEKIALAKIETIIPSDETTCWQPIERIEGEPNEAVAALDEACRFPQPRPALFQKKQLESSTIATITG